MRVRVREGWGEDRDVTWEATGAMDLDQGTSRLCFRAGSGGEPFRDVFTTDSEIYERLTPESDTWRRVRVHVPDEGALTDNYFGLSRLTSAAVIWQTLDSERLIDGDLATGYRAILRRRLGDSNDGTIALVFRATLPIALVRRRLLETWLDAGGHLRRIVVTTDRPGLRYDTPWLELDVWDLGSATVEPMAPDRLLTGSIGQQAHQQWQGARSDPSR